MIQKLRRNKPDEPQNKERITNDTVEQHRREALSRARRFKYPVQYARHKLVINTVIISVLALAVLTLFGWWRMYPGQSTSELTYRITQIAPLPVAEVDGESVRYSDYLMHYRSNEHYLREVEQVDTGSEEYRDQIQHYRQQSMEDAVMGVYATMLARELDVYVEAEEVDAHIERQRGELSERAYMTAIENGMGWSIDEYRRDLEHRLLRQRVSVAVDDRARQLVEEVTDALNDDVDLAEVAGDVDGVEYVNQPWVMHTNQDGGVTQAALALAEGEVSDAFVPIAGDGYYFIHVLDVNDTQVQYEYIYIPLTVFAERIEQLYEDGRVRYHIDVPMRGEENNTPEEE